MKGLDLIQKIKHEMEHNLEHHNQSVKVPIKDLKLLLELAESNQYRLDLELAMELQNLHVELAKHKKPCTHENKEHWNHGYHNRCKDCGEEDV